VHAKLTCAGQKVCDDEVRMARHAFPPRNRAEPGRLAGGRNPPRLPGPLGSPVCNPTSSGWS
jgi:hypothetical protein